MSWDAPPISHLLRLIQAHPTAEIITLKELQILLETTTAPVTYCGYEPSGPVHLGHWISIKKLLDLQNAGFKVKVLLADFHAFLNRKGSLAWIQKVAEYHQHCFIASGGDPNMIEFILGSSFQLDEDYITDLFNLSLDTSIARARRSMAIIGRDMTHAKVSQILYPLMQVADIKWLNVDLAVGDTAQRKVHILARELLPKLEFKKPVALHHALILGLTGGKMSSSIPESHITIHDTPEVITNRINAAYCPAKVVENNPILQWCNHLVFPNLQQPFTVERLSKYGDTIEYLDYNTLEHDYRSGIVHPLDLKHALTNFLVETLSPIRKYFEKHHELLDGLFPSYEMRRIKS